MTPLLSVDLTLKLYEDDMVFRVFLLLFLFRANGKKRHLDENDFCHCYGNFFRKCHSSSRFHSSYLITAILKVLSQQLRGTVTTTF